jgi:hypothetical protein
VVLIVDILIIDYTRYDQGLISHFVWTNNKYFNLQIQYESMSDGKKTYFWRISISNFLCSDFNSNYCIVYIIHISYQTLFCHKTNVHKATLNHCEINILNFFVKYPINNIFDTLCNQVLCLRAIKQIIATHLRSRKVLILISVVSIVRSNKEQNNELWS